jgi:hypothetical protein
VDSGGKQYVHTLRLSAHSGHTKSCSMERQPESMWYPHGAAQVVIHSQDAPHRTGVVDAHNADMAAS